MPETLTPSTPTASIPAAEAVSRVAAASAAWAATGPAERAAVMRAIADALDAAGGELIEIAQQETALAQPRLAGELKRTTFQLRLFADVVENGAYLDARIDRPDAEWPMGAPRPDLRRMLIPIGPALVFAASNFPFAFSVAGGDTAAALAAGNAVLVKAHSGHPRLSDATAAVIARAAVDAGAPADLLLVIHGTQNGVEALKNPAIKVASFTGSIPGGRALFDIANARPEPIPFYGELGSVNPAFVAPDAAAHRATEIAEGYIASVTGSQGQLCTKPGVLLVPTGSDIIDALRGADVPAGAPMLNDRIQSGFVSGLEELASHDAVTVLRDGAASRSAEPELTLLLTSVDALLDDPEGIVTEVFGPAGLVVTYEDAADLERVARGLEGQLTATLVADETDADLALARTLVPALADRAGRVLWNQWPTGVSVTGAQQHGGPYPATTAPSTTAVGTASITRFLRPVAFQNFPAALLPAPLRDDNPLGVPQSVDG
ncbi:NADP-dependent aldehyde dehydrogenase [Microbacterium sp. W4I4]|uniref:aldehyde dehydrogenase (NADP(+)) n=1 Tax=Microbacterium sp. W4I4 TaxID=3042295 RepID=UPI002783E755|nr:aldehyde dehydrogenase (NADP(+)) [Microbacterium sp. W4I4]MDQ0614391.1 NADP-dependent aldehyde dehydrogenase [Microbacterium sp. W4I4]